MSEAISAQAGQPFRVELACAPSTGYTWELPQLPATVQLLGREFVLAPGAAIGDGGVAVFELQAAVAGELTLEFEFKRRWEPQAERRQTVRVLVR